MKKTFRLTLVIFCLLSLINITKVNAQLITRLQITQPIEGICNPEKVYALFPRLEGHQQATASVPEAYIMKRVNEEVQFLKDHPDLNDMGMVKIIINCKGNVVKCEMSDPTQSVELDQQIEEVFNSLGEWKSGKILGENVDSARLFTFKIVNGEFTFNLK